MHSSVVGMHTILGISHGIFCLIVHLSQSLKKTDAIVIWGGSFFMGESYRDLIAWRKAMQFVTAIYQVTQAFPRAELYGLTTQLRRAAVIST